HGVVYWELIKHASCNILPSTEARRVVQYQTFSSLDSFRGSFSQSLNIGTPKRLTITARTPKNSASRNGTDPMNTMNPKIPLLSLCIDKLNSERPPNTRNNG